MEEELIDIISNKNYNLMELHEKLKEFIIKMCELQKQECANNIVREAEVTYNSSVPDCWSLNSILNCKNVCTT